MRCLRALLNVYQARQYSRISFRLDFHPLPCPRSLILPEERWGMSAGSFSRTAAGSRTLRRTYTLLRLAYKVTMVIGINSTCPFNILIYFKITSSSGRCPSYGDVHVEGVHCIQRFTTRSFKPKLCSPISPDVIASLSMEEFDHYSKNKTCKILAFL